MSLLSILKPSLISELGRATGTTAPTSDGGTTLEIYNKVKYYKWIPLVIL